MVTIKSGGGITSNKYVTSRSGMKTEPRSTAINPVEAGPGYSTKPRGDTGIAGARKGPAGAGPGGYGRTIYKSGSQSPTPPAHGMPAGRNTLAEYGPDSVTARGKR